MNTSDPPTTRPARDAPRLVGREREYDALGARLEAAMGGHGSLALISGEAGIGKTALAESVCYEAAARGARVLIGRCYDRTETPPYGPWSEFLAHAEDPALAALLVPDDATIHNQETLFARVRGALLAHAGKSPLVLLLDDLHWADPGSLALLRVVARDLAAHPLLILVTYRAEEIGLHPAFAATLPLLVREARPARLILRSLEAAAVGALVRGRYGGLPDEDATRLAAYLHAHAEGNPFYIGELLHGLEADGDIVWAAGSWKVGDLDAARVPLLVRQVIAQRVGRHGAEAARLLAVAAVIGHKVPFAVWAAVGGVPEETLLALAERAVASGELRETPDGRGVAFAHALIREALSTGMLASRVRALHRAIAETESALPQPDPDSVAAHFRRAEDPRAVAWLIRAGDRAGRAYAYQTAIERFTEALALISDHPTEAAVRGELHIRLARLLRTTETSQAVQHAEEAARLTAAGDPTLGAAVRFRLGYLYGYTGQRARGIAVQLDALAVLDALPEGEMARIAPLDFVAADVTARHGSVALRLVQVGRFHEAARHAERALADATGAMTPLSQDAWTAQAVVERAMGRVAEAWEIGRALTALARAQEEHDVAQWMIGNALTWAALVFWTDDARLNEIRALLDARPPQTGELFAALPPQTLHLAALYITGAWAEARQVIAAVRRSRFARHPFLHGVWLVHALIATAQGETEAAWQIVRATLPDGAATEPGDTQFDAAVTMQQIAATLALDMGDRATAREWLEAHDRWMAWGGMVPGLAGGHLLWARYYRDAGETVRAREHVAAALAAAQAPRQPRALLAAHRLAGELHGAAGRWAEAARDLAAALTLAEACDCPYEQARTLLAWAEVDAATGREWRRHRRSRGRAISPPHSARAPSRRASKRSPRGWGRRWTRRARMRRASPSARPRSSASSPRA